MFYNLLFLYFRASNAVPLVPLWQGEAVRLARQLPSNLTRQEVEDGLSRMTEQLGEDSRTCIHGRPFLQQLSVVPGSEQEARSLLVPVEQL